MYFMEYVVYDACMHFMMHDAFYDLPEDRMFSPHVL